MIQELHVSCVTAAAQSATPYLARILHAWNAEWAQVSAQVYVWALRASTVRDFHVNRGFIMIQRHLAVLCWLLCLPGSVVFAQVPAMLDTPTTQLGTGVGHNCALTSTGRVQCWGANFYGQLGNGASGAGAESAVPVDVQGLSANIVAVSAGAEFTCALNTTGTVQCWGRNDYGQLGDGTTSTSPAPITVPGLSDVAVIGTGAFHACALVTTGEVLCWGRNHRGQLGDGSTTPRPAPTPVQGLPGAVVSIAVGNHQNCAVLENGSLRCWGYNEYGQLGDGSTDNRNLAVEVQGLTNVTAVDTMYGHTCALTQAGAVHCWGLNGNGQLGIGSASGEYPTPQSIPSLAGGVIAITVGNYHSCAVSATGMARCWGQNDFGQLGDDSTADRSSPVEVLGFPGSMTAVAAGANYTCGLDTVGGMACWGRNHNGQLGDGSELDSDTPLPVLGHATGVLDVAGGANHSCALTPSGKAKCWGRNTSGQLGNGDDSDSDVPEDVDGLTTGATQIAAGQSHSCALTAAGGVQCWGENADGQLGTGDEIDSNLPVDVPALPSGVASVGTGYAHSCALTVAGGVKCWGSDQFGQLGDGNNSTGSSTPVDVTGLTSGVVSLGVGYNHTCAVTADGGVQCWGNNEYGMVGDGTVANTRDVPTDVQGLTGASGEPDMTTVSGGRYHTCALTASGGAKCWGRNVHGQLGTGDREDARIPADVIDLSGSLVAIDAGYRHTCARNASGGVQCWGRNLVGQLGDGSTNDSDTPVDVLGLTSGAVAIAAGGYHACAITADQDLRCWGYDDKGQLGNGADGDQTAPVVIRGGQSLAFTPPATLAFGTPLVLSATATGAGTVPIIFDTWTPRTCSISGTTLTTLNDGLCGVRASRASGSDNAGGTQAAVPQQLRLILIGGDVIFQSGFE